MSKRQTPVGRRELSLAHLSLVDSAPPQLIQAAAQAGFDLVDLRLSPATATDPVYSAGERMALCRQLLPILGDAGLRVWDVEIIRINDRTRPDEHMPLMEAAAMLGARRMKVVCDSADQAMAAAVLEGLCRLAAPFGLTLDLEYMVFSGVKSLKAALKLAGAVVAPNLNILVDALHWMRAGDTVSELGMAKPGHLGYVQLCDGPIAGPTGREALIQEARTSRLAPGEGEFPLESLLGAMPARCVASLEVPLPPGHEPLAHARRLLKATRVLIERHDGGGSS